MLSHVEVKIFCKFQISLVFGTGNMNYYLRNMTETPLKNQKFPP